VNHDALHADAALSGLIERAEDESLDRVVNVGIMIDDARRIAAEFEDDFFLAGIGF